MQGHIVEFIRELMQTQRMSVRKISAQIAKKHGGSALGYTQQINRILNDPDYDPTFSTVQKVLAALNYSLWQTSPPPTPSAETIAPATHSSEPLQPTQLTGKLELHLHHLTQEVAELKTIVKHLSSQQSWQQCPDSHPKTSQSSDAFE